MVKRDVAAVALALAGLLLGACDDPVEPAVEPKLQLVSGSDQTGGAGAALASPIVVTVLANDRPLSGAEVRWRVIEGGGEVSEPVTIADSLGHASVRWTLGNDVGQQLLLATSGNASVTIRATGRFEISTVSAGYRHTCAVSTTGAAFCWGLNQQGQLGDGTETTTSVPARVSAAVRFRLIAAGWSHTCGVSTFGESLCWGDNLVGQLGIGSLGGRRDFPTPTAFTDAFVTLSAGFVHTCGVTAAGDAVCWGSNESGQLSGSQPSQARITGLQLRSITTGEFQSCGIRGTNALVCWGWNSNGEIGIGAAPGVIVRTPSQVTDTLRFSHVAAGVRHTCAVSTDGRVYCWGRSGLGETGQDPFNHAPVPSLVAGAAGFSAVGTGNTHTCGLSAQRAYCWGSLLGNGTTGTSRTPVPVSSSLSFSSISVGYEHTCAVADGQVWCWGSNSHGQLGQPGITQSLTPVRVLFPGTS